MKTVLHVGCGTTKMPDFLPQYREIRMDIDPACSPDIVCDLRDLQNIPHVDAVYGAHVLEHFTAGDAAKVLAEFHRVLKPGGICVMVVPNLTGILPTREVIYESPAGPITGLDMYYGKESFIDEHPYMSHKTGFIPATLLEAMSKVFDPVNVRSLEAFNLMGIGVKPC